MKQITPHLLWVGHAGEGRDFRQVFDAGIRALVDLAIEEPPSQPPRELIYCRFPLVDGAGNSAELLLLAATTVATFLRRRWPTLVICGAGMSRAPALAAAGLALVLQESPEECLRRVVEHHPSDVSPALWAEITELLSTPRS